MFAFVSMVDEPLVRLIPSSAVKHKLITLREFTDDAQQADLEWLLGLD